ncbi:fimbrial protein [Providencia huaxiensis]|uniref:fimbrial protein n=1 Tax=Providencia TaxID=586 RepID=UPI002349216D|nr:fimbrial protein [Providencia sp. PROV076]
MNKLIQCAVAGALLIDVSTAFAVPDNLRIIGNLVEEPCTILPGDENIPMDFFDTPEKNFYAYGETPPKEFVIKLSDCDTTIGKFVEVTFSGTLNLALPGFLALSTSSVASGFAVGLQNSDKTPLALEQKGSKLTLQDGANQLRFYAYLKGEPDAIADKTIKVGPYSAVATFKLDYE